MVNDVLRFIEHEVVRPPPSVTLSAALKRRAQVQAGARGSGVFIHVKKGTPWTDFSQISRRT